MSALLEVTGLTVRFGGLTAVRDLSLEVHAGEIVSLIGPNGAGKTTVFNAITGVHAANAGSVRVAGIDLKRRVDGRAVAGWAAIGLVTGAAATVAVNAEALWSAAITTHFRMHAAFPWTQALGDGLAALAPTSLTVVPALVGATLGGMAGWSLWQRTRVTPERAVHAGLARTFQNIRCSAICRCSTTCWWAWTPICPAGCGMGC